MDKKYPSGLLFIPSWSYDGRMGELKLVKPAPPEEPKEVGEWTRWYLVSENDRSGVKQPCIKRSRKVDGKIKWNRYPAKHYKQMKKEELQALLRRLNATFETDKKLAEERYNFDHTYVNIKSLDLFEKNLKKNTTVRTSVSNPMSSLERYALEFFIITNGIPDPSRWHLKEDDWGEWLLEQDLSTSALKRIISTTNRFTKFLNQKIYPDMATPRKLEPIGRAKFTEVNYVRKKQGKNVEAKYMHPDVFEKILVAFETEDPVLLPNVKLCKAFGLRISETLGLDRMKVFEDALLVDEQGFRVKDGKIVRKKVKTNERRVPYWNMSDKAAWALIKKIVPMHPSTLAKKINAVLENFGHTSHDFRRTFITEAHRKHHWKDVQRAAGHTSHAMTMKYDQDDRQLSNKLAVLDDE